MLRFGMGEVIVVLLILLILFGANKLPEMGRALGKGIKEFWKAVKGIQGEDQDSDQSTDNGKTG